MSDKQTNCRGFLAKSAALSAAPLSATESPADEAPADQGSANQGPGVTYQPEANWRERMKAPDDGKKFGWFVDTRRCFGCHGCEVSCKAENDVPLGHYIRQTIYKDVGDYPKVARLFLPMSCQHCEDAPCIKACPCVAMEAVTGAVIDEDIAV